MHQKMACAGVPDIAGAMSGLLSCYVRTAESAIDDGVRMVGPAMGFVCLQFGFDNTDLGPDAARCRAYFR